MTKRGLGAAAEIDLAIQEARAAIGTQPQVESLRSKLAVGLAAAASGASALADAADSSAASQDAGIDSGSVNARGAHAGHGAIATQTSAVSSLVKASLLAAALSFVGTAAWVAKHEDDGGHRSTTPSASSPNATPAAANGASGASLANHNVSPERAPLSAALPDPPGALTPRIGEPDTRLQPANQSAARLPSEAPTEVARGHAGRTSAAGAPRHAPSRASTVPMTRPHASEVELLTRAQALVDSQPSAALALLREHELAYPLGLLREERDVLRIDAEWALGQRSAALAHARAFVQRYPRSTQTRRFETLLADHKTQAEATPTE